MFRPTEPDDFFAEEPLNQVPDFAGRNLFLSDPLTVAFSAALPDSERSELEKLGTEWGSAASFQLAEFANRQKPVLKTHDQQGRRIDQVTFHPSYHALMRRSVAAGLSGSIWEDNADGIGGTAHQARALRFYMAAQVECGHLCPVTMTNAAPAALRKNAEIAKAVLPRLLTRQYDQSHRPLLQKSGATIGMGMTEKQGGSDVSSILSVAEPLGDGQWAITGHKWFFSAPMCDAFLILARTRAGVSCFFVPRIHADGRVNGLRLQRLKDKMGNISNASSEVEFHRAIGSLVGGEGEGVRTILDMVTLTRLDCALASSGIMRSTLAQAVHHARHRVAFKRLLVDQPLQMRVLADLSLDCAAANVLCFRLAESFDRAPYDTGEAAFSRLMTPVIKYWACKVTPSFVAEAMECLGGNGYTEDWPFARAYREAPVNAIWEGSGNIMCLDVLRVLKRSTDGLQIVLASIEENFGQQAEPLINVLQKAAKAALEDEGAARILTEQLALTVAAVELRRIARSDIADAFLQCRLSRPFRSTYGMMDGRFNARPIVDAMCPPV